MEFNSERTTLSSSLINFRNTFSLYDSLSLSLFSVTFKATAGVLRTAEEALDYGTFDVFEIINFSVVNSYLDKVMSFNSEMLRPLIHVMALIT